ncbi:MAG: hypothetical protein ACLFV8_11015, partial [Alphaproteobacteria bacterium]
SLGILTNSGLSPPHPALPAAITLPDRPAAGGNRCGSVQGQAENGHFCRKKTSSQECSHLGILLLFPENGNLCRAEGRWPENASVNEGKTYRENQARPWPRSS